MNILQRILSGLTEEATVITADGYDDCVIGLSYNTIGSPIVIYDADAIIKCLVDRDGMTYDEASEYYEFNILGAYVGEQTPMFVYTGNYEE